MRNRLLRISLILILAFLIGILCLLGVWERLELVTLDLRYKLSREDRFSNSLAIIGITQGCLRSLGESPARSQYAKLVSILAEAGASVIVFDIFFPERETTSSEDRALILAVRKAGNVVLPVFSPDPPEIEKKGPEKFYIARRLQGNLMELEKAAAGIGHINIIPDKDYIVRRAPAYLKYGEKVFPQLGIVAVEVFWKDRPFLNLQAKPPLDREDRFYINYPKPHQFSAGFYAFSKVLKKEFLPDVFKNKIVLVGQTVQGLKNADLAPTPFGYQFGALVEASIINTLLTQRFITRVSHGWTFLLLAVLALFLSFSVFTSKNWSNLIGAVAFLLITFGGSLLLFQKEGLILETAPLFALITTSYIGSLALSRWEALRERQASLAVLDREERAIAALINPFSPLEGLGGTPLKPTEDFRFIKQVPESAVRILAESMGASAGILFTYQQRERRLEPLVSFGAIPGPVKEQLLTVGEEIIKTGKPLVLNRFSLNRNPLFRSLAENIKSLLALPLASPSNNVCAVIILLNKKPSLFSPYSSFTHQEIQLGSIMFLQTILAIQSSKLGIALRDAHLDSILRLAKAVEYRDKETGEHINRLRDYATIIAIGLQLSDYEVDLIRNAVVLHDIGKVGVPDSILLKPGPLTPEERKIIEMHTIIGAQILSQSSSPILRAAEVITLSHHERYNGTGYPYGLAGEKIPLYGRIAAVADVFDAASSKRCYKEALPFNQTLKIIREGAGREFDPQIVDIFLKNLQLD